MGSNKRMARGSRGWVFPPLDGVGQNLGRAAALCARCGPLAGLRLEEGLFDLPVAPLAWAVELAGKKPKIAALILEGLPKARPGGRRRVWAACRKCGASVLTSLHGFLEERVDADRVSVAPARPARGIQRPPFAVDTERYAPAFCLACGKSGRVTFRPASRYGVTDAVLRADLIVERGRLLAPAGVEIVAARKIEPVGSSTEVVVSCGHCGKILPRMAAQRSAGRSASGPPARHTTHADDLALEAQSLLRVARFEEARDIARRASDQDARHPRARLVEALAAFKLKDFVAAIGLLKQVKRLDRRFAESNDVDAWLGATFEAQGELTAAATSFRARLKGRPNDPSAMLALARVLLLRDGPTGTGIKLLRRVARIPLARDRALVDPRLSKLREHPAVRAALGLGT